MIIAVAGPYSASTPAQREKNLLRLNEAAARLLEKGHIPIIGVNAALPVVAESEIDDEYKAIQAISMACLHACEALLLLEESPGALQEKAWMEERGLPVYRKPEEIPSA